MSPALEILGRCDRTTSCEAPAGSAGGGLRMKLHTINGLLLNERLTSDDGWLHQALAAEMSDADLVEVCYLRTVSRLPTADERRYWQEQLARTEAASDRRHLWEDIFWSLLSCREFQTNH